MPQFGDRIYTSSEGLEVEGYISDQGRESKKNKTRVPVEGLAGEAGDIQRWR